jgi:hypothetical protein
MQGIRIVSMKELEIMRRNKGYDVSLKRLQ